MRSSFLLLMALMLYKFIVGIAMDTDPTKTIKNVSEYKVKLSSP